MFGLCRVTLGSSNVFSTTSAFILSLLTIERHRAICNPLKYKDGLKRTQITALVLLLFFFAVLLNVPVAFETRVKAELPVANATNDRHLFYLCKVAQLAEHVGFHIYVIVREAIAKMIPVIVVTLLNVHMIFTLCKHRRSRKQLNCSIDPDRLLEERRLMCLLAAVMVMFLVCSTPKVFVWCMMTNELAETSGPFATLDLIADLLLAINSAGSFYLYFCCSAAVRIELQELLKMIFCRPLVQVAGIPQSIEFTMPSYSIRPRRSFTQTLKKFHKAT